MRCVSPVALMCYVCVFIIVQSREMTTKQAMKRQLHAEGPSRLIVQSKISHMEASGKHAQSLLVQRVPASASRGDLMLAVPLPTQQHSPLS